MRRVIVMGIFAAMLMTIFSVCGNAAQSRETQGGLEEQIQTEPETQKAHISGR